jgi:hypothetical protein
MKTIDLLLSHFGGNPIIPFETAANFLRYKPDTLKQKIDNGEIRIQYFCIEGDGKNSRPSQKAQKFLLLIEIAALIDRQSVAWREHFESVWAEAASI